MPPAFSSWASATSSRAPCLQSFIARSIVEVDAVDHVVAEAVVLQQEQEAPPQTGLMVAPRSAGTLYLLKAASGAVTAGGDFLVQGVRRTIVGKRAEPRLSGALLDCRLHHHLDGPVSERLRPSPEADRGLVATCMVPNR